MLNRNLSTTTEMIETHKRRISLLEIFFILFLLHDYVPIIGHVTPAIVFATLVLGTLVLLLFHIGLARFLQYCIKLIPILVLPFLDFILNSSTLQGRFVYELYGFIQLLDYCLVGLYLIDYKDIHFSKAIIIVLLLSLVSTAITTYFGCLAYPDASRILATGTEYEEEALLKSQFARLNIGGFDFIYSLVMTTPFLVGLMKEKWVNRFWGISVLLCFALTLLTAEYTASILLFVMCLMLLFTRGKYTLRKFRKSIVLGAFILLIGMIPLGNILINVSEKIESEKVATRIRDVGYTLSNQQSKIGKYSDIKGRSDKYKISWNTFKAHPIIGSWNNKNTGRHSFILDSMAKYGTIGIVLLLIMYGSVYRIFFKNNINEGWIGYALFLLLLVIIMAMINPKSNMNFLFVTISSFEIICAHSIIEE